VEIAAILILNDGMLVYSLDDPYIHLSLAKRHLGRYVMNQRRRGIRAGIEHSLALPAATFSSLPGVAYILVPCLLNIVASSATLTLLVGSYAAHCPMDAPLAGLPRSRNGT